MPATMAAHSVRSDSVPLTSPTRRRSRPSPCCWLRRRQHSCLREDSVSVGCVRHHTAYAVDRTTHDARGRTAAFSDETNNTKQALAHNDVGVRVVERTAVAGRRERAAAHFGGELSDVCFAGHQLRPHAPLARSLGSCARALPLRHARQRRGSGGARGDDGCDAAWR